MQLLIYGMIAANGGFQENHGQIGEGEGIGQSNSVKVSPTLIGLEYWHLSGRENVAKIIPLDFLPSDPEIQQQFYAHIEEQLRAMILYYATPSTPFSARLPDPNAEKPFISRDYAHLSRVSAATARGVNS